MSNPLDILKSHWGYTSFRDKQQEIINHILDKKDTVALLPTGGGKSIAFQVPALAQEGVCIVISPLIALIEDQVANLKQRGIKALKIPSGASVDDIVSIFDNIKFGKYKFLYLSPERVQSKLIQEKLCELSISFFAIDEAHCISEWGHDFRPSYTKLNVLRKIAPEANIVALTATATEKVLQDIVTTLELETPVVLKESFYKANLAYHILKTNDKLTKLKQLVERNNAPSIIYVNSRKKTKELSDYLNANGFNSSFYHAGLSSLEKKSAFENWMEETTPIIVATNAFGMGIDKSNVSLVVHYTIPSSLENYVQEAGRAGRNQKQAHAVLLTNLSDIENAKTIFNRSQPTLNDIKAIHKKLYQHFQISLGEVSEENHGFNILEFCDKYNFSPSKTFNALQILNNYGIVEFTQGKQKKSTLQFTADHHSLIQYKNTQFEKRKLIDTILRMYAGVFDTEVKINEFAIAKNVGMTSSKVIEILQKIDSDDIIEYKSASTDSGIVFLLPREDDKTINRNGKAIEKFLQHKQQKLNEILQYIENDSICKSIQLLHYFGEKNSKKCGSCSVCKNNNKTKTNCIPDILNILKVKNNVSLNEFMRILQLPESDILIHLRALLAEEKIGITNTNTYFLK